MITFVPTEVAIMNLIWTPMSLLDPLINYERIEQTKQAASPKYNFGSSLQAS
jgi:hypothetical protein